MQLRIVARWVWAESETKHCCVNNIFSISSKNLVKNFSSQSAEYYVVILAEILFLNQKAMAALEVYTQLLLLLFALFANNHRCKTYILCMKWYGYHFNVCFTIFWYYWNHFAVEYLTLCAFFVLVDSTENFLQNPPVLWQTWKDLIISLTHQEPWNLVTSMTCPLCLGEENAKILPNFLRKREKRGKTKGEGK